MTLYSRVRRDKMKNTMNEMAIVVTRTQVSVEASAHDCGDKITVGRDRPEKERKKNHAQNPLVSPTTSKNFSIPVLRFSTLVLKTVALSSMLQRGYSLSS